MIGELLHIRLTSAGYRASWAKDGRDALDRLFDIMPQLIVLDLGLPRVSGFDVLERIRRYRVFETLPVVVLTARQNPEDVKRAVALGACDYLAKPFDGPALIKRLERHLAPRKRPPDPPKGPEGDWLEI